MRPYVREILNIGSDIIHVKSMRESYPHLAVLDPVRKSYGDIEMMLGQDVYHAMCPLECFSADEKKLTVRCWLAYRLGFQAPTSVKFKLSLKVFQSQY